MAAIGLLKFNIIFNQPITTHNHLEPVCFLSILGQCFPVLIIRTFTGLESWKRSGLEILSPPSGADKTQTAGWRPARGQRGVSAGPARGQRGDAGSAQAALSSAGLVSRCRRERRRATSATETDTHARTHARTHIRTHARTHAHTHARMTCWMTLWHLMVSSRRVSLSLFVNLFSKCFLSPLCVLDLSCPSRECRLHDPIQSDATNDASNKKEESTRYASPFSFAEVGKQGLPEAPTAPRAAAGADAQVSVRSVVDKNCHVNKRRR